MESVTPPISADNWEFTVFIIIINPISSFRKEIPLLNLLTGTLNKAGPQYFCNFDGFKTSGLMDLFHVSLTTAVKFLLQYLTPSNPH